MGVGMKVTLGRRWFPLTPTLSPSGGEGVAVVPAHPLRVRRRFSASIILLAAMLMACAGPGPSASGQRGASEARPAAAIKRIAVAIKGDPPSLSDKIVSAGQGGVPGVPEVARLINAGLVILDDAGTLRPLMAEAAPSTENGLWQVLSDGRMETTWRIREGAHWHDGTPLTSADLVFTATIGQDPDMVQFQDRSFTFLDRVEAMDARTVKAHWKRPYIEADTMFTEAHALPIPRHILEPVYAENKAGFVEHPYWTREFIGTGPYRLQQWESGSHMVIAADALYPLGRPKIDEIEVKFITDPNTMIANLLAGAIDLTMGRGLALEQAQTIQAQRSDVRMDLAVDGCLCAFPQYLNPTPASMVNVPFRRALTHAVDRKELANTLAQGLVAPAEVFVGPNEPEYRDIQPSIARYDFDPRRSAQLLEEEGYTRGADGFFRDAAGQRLSVEMRTTSGVETGKNLLFAVADYWQSAGIGAEPVIIPPQQARDREYRANFPGFDMVNQPSSLTLLQRFLSREASVPENRYEGNNRMRYMNAELDTLIDRYFVTVPWGERMQVAGQTIHHITDRAVNMPLLYNTTAVLSNGRLKGATATSTAWNSHVWEWAG